MSNYLFGCGNNSYNQISLTDQHSETLTYKLCPIPILSKFQIEDIASGCDFSLVLLRNGKVVGCGKNDEGEIQENGYEIEFPHENCRIKKISCGAHHAAFLSSSGTLYMRGSNRYNQLGKIELKNSFECIAILTDEYIRDVYCTSYSTFVVTDKHELVSFGRNDMGQLGYLPWQGKKRTAHLILPFEKRIKKICGGSCSTMILTEEGEVYATGLNAFFQMGMLDSCHEFKKMPDLPDNIVDIESGSSHSVFLTQDGKVYVCGRNHKGECGKERNKDLMSPVLLFDEKTYICSIFSRFSRSYFVTKDSKLLCCGANRHGETGVGGCTSIFAPDIVEFPYYPMKHFVNKKIKVSPGEFHTLVLVS